MRLGKISWILIGMVHLLIPTIGMFTAVLATPEPCAKPHNRTEAYELTSIVGGVLYSTTGALNVVLLSRDARLSPKMVYTNSIMAWSSFFFGPAIAYVHLAPQCFPLDYGRWYATPNFGWGVEWGLQLLGPAGSGLRAVVIMTLSIASYFLTFAFDDPNIGFYIAFAPQCAAAILMCVICFCRYRSAAAARALVMWVSACGVFLVLNMVTGLPPVLQTCLIQLCDNTQIHFSIRFFVCMFRMKHGGEDVSKSAALAPGGAVAPGPETSPGTTPTTEAALESGQATGEIAPSKVKKPEKATLGAAVQSEASAGSWWC